jgi:hypothetical protein
VFVAISSVVHSSLADLGGLPLQGCLTFGLSLFRLLARMDCLACWFLAVPAPLESANSGSASCLFLGVVASLALTLPASQTAASAPRVEESRDRHLFEDSVDELDLVATFRYVDATLVHSHWSRRRRDHFIPQTLVSSTMSSRLFPPYVLLDSHDGSRNRVRSASQREEGCYGVRHACDSAGAEWSALGAGWSSLGAEWLSLRAGSS